MLKILAASWVGLALIKHRNSICLFVFPVCYWHIWGVVSIPFSTAPSSLWSDTGNVRVQRCTSLLFSLPWCRMISVSDVLSCCSHIILLLLCLFWEDFAFTSCFLAPAWNNACEREALFPTVWWEEIRLVKVWSTFVSGPSWTLLKFDIQLLAPRTKVPSP